MNYCNIKKTDIADGPGVRVSLFVSGCTHHCKGCFQPETWSFDYGDPFTEDTQRELLEALSPDYIAGLTLLGGEPFEPDNQRALLPLLREARRSLPGKTIWAYSGYELEELAGWVPGLGRARCGSTDEMLSLIDVLVDGEFMQEKKNISLLFRGSENQRLISVKKSLEQGNAVLCDE
ncbi:MAG: anaerobic ribonucleoside-triphosphate reductase activating protein [Lachnospiraceae bacterium]|nr:anaerobic ribonucleoside-triphosphate reductase activating protein [Lachnospiraceae bacterium]